MAAAARAAGITAEVAALFLLLRVMAVSRWDWATAGNVADTVNVSDAASIVLGTLFAEPVFTGIAVLVLLPLATANLIWPAEARGRRDVRLVLLLAGLVAVAGSLITALHYWWVLGGLAVVAVTVIGLRRAKRRGASHHVVELLIHGVGIVVVAATLIVAAAVSTPWAALERIETAGGTIDGYVLQSTSGFLHVLTARDRHVIRVKTADVTARVIIDG